MTGAEKVKQALLDAIVRGTPKQLWADLRPAARQAYADSFFQIKADPNILNEHRILRLRQDRHFRLEFLLASLADRYGLTKSVTLLDSNGQHFVYVVSKHIGMTQSYVRSIGELPKPAEYWHRLASANDIPRLDLGDEPPEVLEGKAYYGLIAHTPVGHKFDEESQKLGMIQFCAPTRDGKAWGAELSIEEILAAYPDEKKVSKPTRAPKWKGDKKDDKKDGTG